MPCLLIAVFSHSGRYHGQGDWPPTPARLFQALLAGAGSSGPLRESDAGALEWLEGQCPPVIAVPSARVGQSMRLYLPSNDLDSKKGDPRRIGAVRTSKKQVVPRIFEQSIPFLYGWSFEEEASSKWAVNGICGIANRLYQFGRGEDMAWAIGEVLTVNDFDARLARYAGRVYVPSNAGSGTLLACPAPGSLVSLRARYAANSRRFKTEQVGKNVRQYFSQPPKPRFRQVTYQSPPSRFLYDVSERAGGSRLHSWPLAGVSSLVVAVRDAAVGRLRAALRSRTDEIERVMVGRKADGADGGPTSLRVRITPVPSIGHVHVNRGIGRVLVEVPSGCPLRPGDVQWAFSGLEFSDPTGSELVLTRSIDERMLHHYAIAAGSGYRVWRTVTPVAFPESAKRRRIEPTRRAEEAKGGLERTREHASVAKALAQALRHAGVRTRAQLIRAQREPFEARGERVERFAPGTRFAKERLWHLELAFDQPLKGPLMVGDGRFLGLGLMAPLREPAAVHAFVVEDGIVDRPVPADVTRALRRALMARVQEVLGRRATLPAFFSGHASDGAPAKTEQVAHLTCAFDPRSSRLLIVAPHIVEHRNPRGYEIKHLEELNSALAGFRELRAGPAGRLTLRHAPVDLSSDPLFAPSRAWEAVTDYRVTRHTKHVGATEAVAADVLAECRRRRLPKPQVTVREPRGVPGVGVVARPSLSFEIAVPGPIILGKTRHAGGGLLIGAGR